MLTAVILAGCAPEGPHKPTLDGGLPAEGPGMTYDIIRPVFQKNCTPCHTFDYSYSSIAPLAKDGKNSLVYKYIIDKKPREMPPPDSQQSREMSNKDRELIANWVLGGARGPNSNPRTTEVIPVVQPLIPKNSTECFKCHGGGGRSTISIIPSLAGLPKEYIIQQLMHFREGTRTDITLDRMNEIATGLTTDEIEKYASYYSSIARTKKGVTLQPLTDEKTAYAQIIMRAESCNSCHDPNSGISAPQIINQNEGYLRTQLVAFRTGHRPSPTTMEPIAKGLTPDEINILAIWLSQGAPKP